MRKKIKAGNVISILLSTIMLVSTPLSYSMAVGIDYDEIGVVSNTSSVDIADGSALEVVGDSGAIDISDGAEASSEIGLADAVDLSGASDKNAEIDLSGSDEKTNNELSLDNDITVSNDETVSSASGNEAEDDSSENADLTDGEENEDSASLDLVKEEEKTVEEIRASYFSDTDVDMTALSELDFSSMRLVVIVSDETQILDPENIMSSYNGLYLMQYLSEDQAKRAYVHYQTFADAVSVDSGIELAETQDMTEQSEDTEIVNHDEAPSLDTPMTDVSAIDTSADPDASNHADLTGGEISDEADLTAPAIVADDGMSSDENPVTELAKQIEETGDMITLDSEGNEISLASDKDTSDAASDTNSADVSAEEEATVVDVDITSPDASSEPAEPASEKEHPLIALIDSGASANEHITERVSMLGDAVEDDNGHGDRMVGYILEEDPDARILSIKALDENGKGTISSVYAAMEYAIHQGAGIINLSISAYSTEENSVLAEIVKRAVEQGIVVVGAAGNQGMDAKFFTPGNIEEAIIVGACDASGNRLGISNYGDTVDGYVKAETTSEAAARYSGRYFLNSSFIDEEPADETITDLTEETDITSDDDNVEDLTGVDTSGQFSGQAASDGPYKIHFNANGGTGTMDDQWIYYDEYDYAPLKDNTFTRNGYIFAGWGYSPTDTLSLDTSQAVPGVGSEGQVISPLVNRHLFEKRFFTEHGVEAGGTLNLYALWYTPTSGHPAHSVNYNLNGGTLVNVAYGYQFFDTDHYFNNSSALRSLVSPRGNMLVTNEGYRFTGWIMTELGNRYGEGHWVTRWTTSGTLHVVAQWEQYTDEALVQNHVLEGFGTGTDFGDTFRLDSADPTGEQLNPIVAPLSYDGMFGPYSAEGESIYYRYGGNAPAYRPTGVAGTQIAINEDYLMTPPNGTRFKVPDSSQYGNAYIIYNDILRSEEPNSISYTPGAVLVSRRFPTTFPLLPTYDPFGRNRDIRYVRFRYEPIPYTISYNLSNGETNNPNNPTEYTVMHGVRLYNPTREGYIFKGWKDQNGSVYWNNSESDDPAYGINYTTGNDAASDYTNIFPNGGESVYYKFSHRRTGNLVLTPRWKKIGSEGSFIDEATGFIPQVVETEKNLGKFKLVETKQPGGFILDPNNPASAEGTILNATLNADNQLEVEVNNDPNYFIIKKVDKTGAALGGAVFNVWNEASPTNIRTVETASITGLVDDIGNAIAIGEAHVERVEPGIWHYQEIQAPSADYVLDNTVYTVRVNTDGTIDGNISRPPVVNYPVNDPRGHFTIIKQSDTGEPMSGVVFTTTVPGFTTATTDANGQIIMNDIAPGTYTYRETSLPAQYAGYTADTTTYSFTVDSTGKTYQNSVEKYVGIVINRKNRLIIRKVNSGGTLLTGATIEIRKDGTLWKTIVLSTGTIELTGLPNGTYTYRETVAPVGYASTNTWMALCTVSGGKIDGDFEKTVSITNPPTVVRIQKNDASGTGLAGATIRVSCQNPVYQEDFVAPTGGLITINGLKPGTYTFKEILPPPGFVLLNGVSGTFTINELGTVTYTSNSTSVTASSDRAVIANTPNAVTIYKKDTSGAKVPGVTFHFTYEGDYGTLAAARLNGADHVTDTADGKIAFTQLPPGLYKYYETAVPAGIILDATEHAFTVTNTGSIETRQNDTVSETRPNDLSIVYTITDSRIAKLTITLSKTGSYKDNTTRPLTGAGFTLYASDAQGTTGTSLGAFTANGDGTYMINNISLSPTDTLYFLIKETTVPAGYIKMNDRLINVPATRDETVTVSVTADDPQNGLEIVKRDSKDDLPLEGVVFTLKKKNASTNAYANLSTHTTDNKGEISIDGIASGDYMMEETTWPAGYHHDPANFKFTVDDEGHLQLTAGSATNNVDISGQTSNVRATVTATNRKIIPDPHPVKITKKGAYNQTYAGAVFSLYEWNGTTYVAKTDNPFVDNNDGTYTLTVPIERTDANQGKFKAVEVTPPPGHQGGWSEEFVISEDIERGIELSLTATNAPVSLVITKTMVPSTSTDGTVFRFWPDSDTIDMSNNYRWASETDLMVTNNVIRIDGLRDGTYYLQETTAKQGYVRDDTIYTVHVENGQVWVGSDTAHKSAEYAYTITNNEDSLTVRKVDFSGTVLPNAVFTISGTATRTATSDASGLAVFKQLPQGFYTLEETTAPPGYIRDESVIHFYVDGDHKISGDDFEGESFYDGQVTITAKNHKVQNGTLRIEKVNQSNTNLAGAVFGVYAWSQENQMYGRSVIVGYEDTDYEEDPPLDEDGNPITIPETQAPIYDIEPTYTVTSTTGIVTQALTFTEDNLGKFMVKEIASPDGYYSDFVAYIDTNERETWDFTRGGLGPVTNTPTRLTIVKTNEDGELLEGAKFRIWNDKDGSANAVEYTSNGNGEIVLTGYHCDTTYHLKETKAPRGHATIKEELSFYVDKTGSVYGRNDVVLTLVDPEGGGARKLIVNCIVDDTLPAYEDISFIYDVDGVNDSNETVHFVIMLTPRGVITNEQVAKYVTPLYTDKSKIATGMLLTLPEGEYTVTQRKPQRYKLNEVVGETENAVKDGYTMKVDLEAYDFGEVTFVNVLTRYNMFTSASIRDNHAGPDYVDPTI